MAEMTTMKIADIHRVPDLQARASMDENHVVDIRDHMKRKGKLPRPKCIRIDDPEDSKHHDNVYVWDGHHTIEASLNLGKTMIPVAVNRGTWQEARDLAASANPHTALKRDERTKRRAIRMMLEDHPDWSDPKIAKHTHTSPSLVADERPNVTVAAESATRVGLDGKVRKATQKPKTKRAEATSNGTPPKRPEPETFDWKLFDSHFGWVVRSVDALESMTKDKKTADNLRETLNEALEIFNQWRSQTNSKEK